MAYHSINKSLRFSTPRGDLEVVEKEIPPLPANELLVKVKAASINPVDVQLWSTGLVGVVAGDKGMGRDFSGTVVSVGKNVKGWAEGDEIFGLLFHVVSCRLKQFELNTDMMAVWARYLQSVRQRQSNIGPDYEETRMLYPRPSCVHSTCGTYCICMS